MALSGSLPQINLGVQGSPSEEFVAVNDDKVYTALNLTKTFWGLTKAEKYILDADSDDENKMNNAAPNPTLSEMRNIIKNMCNYLDAHSNGEMNNKMDDIEQFVDSLMLKKAMQRKIYQIIFPKLNK
ncbi:uncharacterized protein TNCV_4763111 [Trichonephila clavipes]|nr:uncharacterized protein TNCV_4763111 [Trichonephila clavipes]